MTKERPKTSAERNKDYRSKRKLLQLHLPKDVDQDFRSAVTARHGPITPQECLRRYITKEIEQWNKTTRSASRRKTPTPPKNESQQDA